MNSISTTVFYRYRRSFKVVFDMSVLSDWQAVIQDFKAVVPSVGFWSLRLVRDETESLHVRDDVVQPPSLVQSRGAHISFIDRGGMAYAATSALNRAGLRAACERALDWLAFNRRHALIPADSLPRPERSGDYATPLEIPWEAWSLNDKLERLQAINRALNIDEAIVDRQARLSCRRNDVILLTSDGARIEQRFHYLMPGYAAVANRGAQTQLRSGGGWGSARQGGLEQLAGFDFPDSARQVAEEAIALVDAPECPNTCANLLVLPSQMMLQIHESIGHPLELDRILGDERN